MTIEYKFANVYAEHKKRTAKADFRNKVCEGCKYDKSAFWRRLRGDFENITVAEILVWMQLSGKEFNDIVVYEKM